MTVLSRTPMPAATCTALQRTVVDPRTAEKLRRIRSALEKFPASGGTAASATDRNPVVIAAAPNSTKPTAAPAVVSVTFNPTTRTHVLVQFNGDPIRVEVVDRRIDGALYHQFMLARMDGNIELAEHIYEAMHTPRYLEIASSRSRSRYGDSANLFVDSVDAPEIRLVNERTGEVTTLDSDGVEKTPQIGGAITYSLPSTAPGRASSTEITLTTEFTRSNSPESAEVEELAATGMPASTPAADDYSRYVDREPIPGRDGSLSQLATSAVMAEYKDAEPGTNERKYFDLLSALSLAENGFQDNDRFDNPLSPDEVQNNVIFRERVEEELRELLADADFQKSYEAKFREKLGQAISDNFIVLNGQITLFDPENREHTTVEREEARDVRRQRGRVVWYERVTVTVSEPANHPRADIESFGAALLAGTVNDENIEKYKIMTPEEQQTFIKERFGPLSLLLPPDKVSEAMATFGASVAITSVLGTDIRDIPNEDLSTGAQLAGLWLLKMRGPINLIGNLSNLRPEQWEIVANTFKNMVGLGHNPADFDAFMANLPASAKNGLLGDTMKSLAANGLFGNFAAYTAIIGATVAYGSDGPARERLLAGDFREVMNLVNNLVMVVSYSPSLVKGHLALMSAFGINSAEDFLQRFKDLPDAGRMVTSFHSRFQPTFVELGRVLQGIDLSDEIAVLAALRELDPAMGRKFFSEFGYDFQTLAKRISSHAKNYAPNLDDLSNVTLDTAFARAADKLEAAYGVRSLRDVTGGSNLQAFVFDSLGVESNLRIVNRANQILTDAAVAPLDGVGVSALLSAAGMSDADIAKVMGYAGLDPASFFASPRVPSFAGPSMSAAGEVDLATRLNSIPNTAPVEARAVFGDLLQESLDKKLALTRSTVPAPFKGAGVAKFGLAVRALSSGMDVIGGIAGVGVGIFDIIKGAEKDDAFRITAGALGIGSGIAGTLGGLAGFGMIVGAAATPLFVIAGVLGVVSIVVSLFSGDMRWHDEQFSDALLERYRDYGILRQGSGSYVRSYWLNNQNYLSLSDGGMS